MGPITFLSPGQIARQKEIARAKADKGDRQRDGDLEDDEREPRAVVPHGAKNRTDVHGVLLARANVGRLSGKSSGDRAQSPCLRRVLLLLWIQARSGRRSDADVIPLGAYAG